MTHAALTGRMLFFEPGCIRRSLDASMRAIDIDATAIRTAA
jgi:hypothetical protein